CRFCCSPPHWFYLYSPGAVVAVCPLMPAPSAIHPPRKNIIEPLNLIAKEPPMPHRRTRLFSIASGLGLCLAFAPAAFAGTSNASDLAPVKNGAAQVQITLTGDSGGTCRLDYHAAEAGPITFNVT